MTTAKVKEKNELKLIITGCGHSGTRYIAAVLEAAGFNVGHEQVTRPGGVYPPSKYPQGLIEVSWTAAGYLDKFPGAEVWQITRNPLDVANTFFHRTFFAKVGEAYRDFAASQDGVVLGDTHPELDYWIDWNAMIAPRASSTYQVEDIRENLPGFLKAAAAAVGLPAKSLDIDAAQRVGQVGESRCPKTYTATGYSRLGELLDAAKGYGYDLGIKKPRAKKAAKAQEASDA